MRPYHAQIPSPTARQIPVLVPVLLQENVTATEAALEQLLWTAEEWGTSSMTDVSCIGIASLANWWYTPTRHRDNEKSCD